MANKRISIDTTYNNKKLSDYEELKEGVEVLKKIREIKDIHKPLKRK